MKKYLITFCLCLISFQTWACPVCFSAKEGTLMAFYLTTALLTFLPLSLMGGFALWYRRRLKQINAQDSTESH